MEIRISSLPELKLKKELPKFHVARCYEDENKHGHIIIEWAGRAHVDIDTFDMTEEEVGRSINVALKSLEQIRKQLRQKRRLH